jgi:hypothetical protein
MESRQPRETPYPLVGENCMYEPSTNYATLDFKPFDCQEKVKEFIALLKYPEVQAVLKLFIDNSIVTSDLQILQRLATLEAKLGLNDLLDSDEPTIPEQLSILADRIDTQTIREPSLEPVQVCATYTGVRAHLLIQYLEKDIGANDFGELEVRSRDFRTFIEKIIPENYRTMNTTNLRQLKKQIFETAVKLFPEKVFIHKSLGGNRETSLVFKKRNRCN